MCHYLVVYQTCHNNIQLLLCLPAIKHFYLSNNDSIPYSGLFSRGYVLAYTNLSMGMNCQEQL